VELFEKPYVGIADPQWNMLRPPAIAGHERAGIPPRLNKKSKTFNWAGGVNITPSFTGERNLPNISKSTFKFLKCQGKEGRAHRAWSISEFSRGIPIPPGRGAGRNPELGRAQSEEHLKPQP